MTEIGGYASALALAASAWGGCIALSPLWGRPPFRAASRRAGAAAATLLVLALVSLGWAAWTADVRYSFVARVAELTGSAPARLLALPESPACRFLIFLTLFALFGGWACAGERWGGLERRRWTLVHAITFAGVLVVSMFADPWSVGAAEGVFVPPESLEPGSLVARSLRLVSLAGWAVVFVLVWSAIRELRENGAVLRGPYLWGVSAWLFMTASVGSEYAVVEGRVVDGLPLEAAAWRVVPPWLLGLAFLHVAALGRRRPAAPVLSLALGVAVFPLAFPLLGDGVLPWPWAIGALAAAAVAVTATGRAARERVTPRAVALWSRGGFAAVAAGLLTALASLALGARLAGGTLPGAVWAWAALLAASLSALALALPGVRGAARRAARRVAPVAAAAALVAALVGVLSGDLWFGVAAGLVTLNLGVAGRELLAARPGRSTLWLWGAPVAHTGLAALVLGLAAARLGAARSAEMAPGDVITVRSPVTGTVEFKYLGLSLYASGGTPKWAASVEVTGLRDGPAVARAEQRELPGRSELYHVPALVRALTGAAHIELLEVLSVSGERVRLQVTVRPLASLVWSGLLLLMAGAGCGFAAALGRGERGEPGECAA